MTAQPFYAVTARHMKPMTAYGVVHYLLRKQRGPASKRWCVECGKPAQQWAYDQEDVFERIDMELPRPRAFSINFDHYQAMCQPCHARLDMKHAARVVAAIEHNRRHP